MIPDSNPVIAPIPSLCLVRPWDSANDVQAQFNHSPEIPFMGWLQSIIPTLSLAGAHSGPPESESHVCRSLVRLMGRIMDASAVSQLPTHVSSG